MEQHTELLNTQNNAGNNHSNESTSLIERNNIENSPFVIVKQNGKFFLTIGKYRITEPTDTEEETLNKFITEHWNITTNLIINIIEQLRPVDRLTGETMPPYETESL